MQVDTYAFFHSISILAMYLNCVHYKVREPKGNAVVLTVVLLFLFSFPLWTTVLLISKLLYLLMLQSNTLKAAGVFFLYTGKNTLPNSLVTGNRRAVLLNPPT